MHEIIGAGLIVIMYLLIQLRRMQIEEVHYSFLNARRQSHTLFADRGLQPFCFPHRGILAVDQLPWYGEGAVRTRSALRNGVGHAGTFCGAVGTVRCADVAGHRLCFRPRPHVRRGYRMGRALDGRAYLVKLSVEC